LSPEHSDRQHRSWNPAPNVWCASRELNSDATDSCAVRLVEVNGHRTDRRGSIRHLGLGDTAAADLFRLAWVGRFPLRCPGLPYRQLGWLGRRAPDTLRLPGVVRPGRTGLLRRARVGADPPHTVSALTARSRHPDVAASVREGRPAAIPDEDSTRVSCAHRSLPVLGNPRLADLANAARLFTSRRADFERRGKQPVNVAVNTRGAPLYPRFRAIG
jgi:hypothetical protein